jgi:hypothetical protein
MKIKHSFSVDTGGIIIASVDFLKPYGFKYNKEGGIIVTLPKNTLSSQEITYSCLDTWDGSLKGKDVIWSGKTIFIGDPCYHIKNENLMNILLDSTDCYRRPNENYLYLSTGGDGSFDFDISIENTEKRNYEKRFIDYHRKKISDLKKQIKGRKNMENMFKLIEKRILKYKDILDVD